MMGHKICFNLEIWPIVPKSSLLPLLICSTDTCHRVSIYTRLTLLTTSDENTVAEFANSIDLDEVAHNEPPHKIYTVCSLVFEFSI